METELPGYQTGAGRTTPVEQLRLAIRLLLTEHEVRHLKELASNNPIPLDRRAWTNKIYEMELRRLRALGLIEGSVGDYFRAGDDAHKHLKITEEGVKYLQAKAEQAAQVQAGEPSSSK